MRYHYHTIFNRITAGYIYYIIIYSREENIVQSTTTLFPTNNIRFQMLMLEEMYKIQLN